MPHTYDPVCTDGHISGENSRSSPPMFESQYSEIRAVDFSKGSSRSRSVSPDTSLTAGIRTTAKSYGAVNHEDEENPYSYVNVNKKRRGGPRSKEMPTHSTFPSEGYTSEQTSRSRTATSILQVCICIALCGIQTVPCSYVAITM